MERIYCRRIVLEPHLGRGDVAFIFFGEGNATKPLLMVYDFELMNRLLPSIFEQLTTQELEALIVKIRESL